MGKRVNLSDSEKPQSVQNKQSSKSNGRLLFSFAQFSLSPINLEKRFNNFYKDEEDYLEKISILVGKALPMLSREDETVFQEDQPKAKALHLHKVRHRREIMQDILIAYKFPQETIDNIIEGDQVYQLEVPYINGAARIVFNRVDNLISFLFVDPNHHIYMKEELVDRNNSLFYEYCPVYQDGKCIRMDYFGTCFAYEYLDEIKFKAAYESNYDPEGLL